MMKEQVVLPAPTTKTLIFSNSSLSMDSPPDSMTDSGYMSAEGEDEYDSPPLSETVKRLNSEWQSLSPQGQSCILYPRSCCPLLTLQ